MDEEVKRLAPTMDTLRRLYSLSGNQCAFPGCVHMMFNEEGNFVGQICHIEAALEGGERFNKEMSNEDRRHFDNLLLMCYDHHIETNKVDIYPTSKMKQIKEEHEKKFSDLLLTIKMEKSFEDITKSNKSKDVKSLSKLIKTVDNDEWRDEEGIREDIHLFNMTIQDFIKMSPQAISIFKIAMERASTNVKELNGNYGDNYPYIDCNELFRVSPIKNENEFHSICNELKRKNFFSFEEDDNIFILNFPNSEEMNFWFYLVEYNKQIKINYSELFNTFDFTMFD